MSVINTYQLVGVILTAITSIWIWCFVREETFVIDTVNAKVVQIGRFKVKPTVILKYIYLIVLHLFVMFCISTVGGITDAKWITSIPIWETVEDFTLFDYFISVMVSALLYVLPMFLTFVVGYLVMGLIKFEFDISHTIFFLTFLVSVFGWCHYLNDYNVNIEYVIEESQETYERELVFFYDIPMQEISESTLETSGQNSGYVFTVDEVPYVYLNEEGNGVWDFVPAEDSEIVFITEKGAPKLVIVTNISKEIKIDHNTDETSVVKEDYWNKYYFYLPRTLIQTFEAE